MLLLKIVKTLFLIIMSFFFIISLFVFQINFMVKETVFSDRYFNRVFDEHITPEKIESLVQSATANLEELLPNDRGDAKVLDAGKKEEISLEMQQMIDSFKDILTEDLDIDWIKTEVPIMIKGFFAYFTTNSESIPLLDIRPLKSVFVKVNTQSIIAHSGLNSAREIQEIFDRIEAISGSFTLSGKVNEKALDAFYKIDQFKAMGLSREAVENILMKAADRDQIGITEQALLEIVVTEFVNERMGVSKMRDELDFNLLFDTIYEDRGNPVYDAKEMGKGIRRIVFTTNILLVLFLLLIIASATFYPKSLLRWVGVCLVISSILGIIAFIMGGVGRAFLNGNLKDLLEKTKVLDLNFIQLWILAYLGGMLLFVLIESLILLRIGVICIVVSFFVARPKSENTQALLIEPEHRNVSRRVPVILGRVFIILLLLCAIPLCVRKSTKNIRSEIEVFNGNNNKVENQDKKIAMNEALDKVLNTTFFSALSGNGTDGEE